MFIFYTLIIIFYSDLVTDCMDGSDESETVCNEVCQSPQIWISESGCFESASTAFLGKYNVMPAEFTEPNGQ